MKKEGSEGKGTLHTTNAIVGVIFLFLVTVSRGGLILESMYCAAGVRCD